MCAYCRTMTSSCTGTPQKQRENTTWNGGRERVFVLFIARFNFRNLRTVNAGRKRVMVAARQTMSDALAAGHVRLFCFYYFTPSRCWRPVGEGARVWENGPGKTVLGRIRRIKSIGGLIKRVGRTTAAGQFFSAFSALYCTQMWDWSTAKSILYEWRVYSTTITTITTTNNRIDCTYKNINVYYL